MTPYPEPTPSPTEEVKPPLSTGEIIAASVGGTAGAVVGGVIVVSQLKNAGVLTKIANVFKKKSDRDVDSDMMTDLMGYDQYRFGNATSQFL